MLDKVVPQMTSRWLCLGAFLALYVLRVWLLRGWYIVTYGLGIYLLSLFIGFISPQVRVRRALAGVARACTGGALLISPAMAPPETISPPSAPTSPPPTLLPTLQKDPETDGPLLPINGGGDAEYRPFSRRVPEFQAWCVWVVHRRTSRIHRVGTCAQAPIPSHPELSPPSPPGTRLCARRRWPLS